MRFSEKFAVGVLMFCCFVALSSGAVFAQTETCYDDGTFGPTCSATAAPTQAPAPATETPIPELPKSGSVETSLAIFMAGSVLLFLGYKFAYSRSNHPTI